jgi:hypothetical protein
VPRVRFDHGALRRLLQVLQLRRNQRLFLSCCQLVPPGAVRAPSTHHPRVDPGIGALLLAEDPPRRRAPRPPRVARRHPAARCASPDSPSSIPNSPTAIEGLVRRLAIGLLVVVIVCGGVGVASLTNSRTRAWWLRRRGQGGCGGTRASR